ncbi:hypothetical protein HYH03_008747 [Edaphochlamys debaryana]|nr:hypothetical protein HYH03_008747 [Edaphochlamys debaryana]|eukprot:KAG2493084.1 hypothetical protein HYH03_008747 [Edaphochlamys debaryana]
MAQKTSALGTPLLTDKGDVCCPADATHRTPYAAGHVDFKDFTSPTRKVLQQFDDNGEGRVGANVIQAVVSTLVTERLKSKIFKTGIVALGIFVLLLFCAVLGMSWAMVATVAKPGVQNTIQLSAEGHPFEIPAKASAATADTQGQVMHEVASSRRALGGIAMSCAGKSTTYVSNCRDAYVQCYGNQDTLTQAQTFLWYLSQCRSSCASGWSLV